MSGSSEKLEFKETSMVRIHDEELGGSKHTWVYLEGRPGVNVGRALTSKKEAIRRAEKYWKTRDLEEGLTSLLREQYGRQVYLGSLPTHGIAWEGPPGRYVYVLKDRKSRGKYVVLEAIELK